MKIVYLIDSLAAGGAERSLEAMAPHLRDAGVELTVGYLRDSAGVEVGLLEGGARLESLAGGGGRAGRIARAVGLIRSSKPDLVHTTLTEADLAGRIAARLAGVRVVSTIANEAYGPVQRAASTAPGWKLRAVHGADLATARLVHRFHAISRAVAVTMGERLRLAPGRIEVIPRGRDRRALGYPSPERRRRVRESLGVGDDPVILAAARQEHQKGVDVLAAAMPAVVAAHRGARLVLAGRQGGSTAEIHSRLARLDPGSVSVLGPRADVPDLLCAADVVAIPSRWEGLGGTAVEAMALSTPIVASDLPVLRELAGDTAAFVPVANPAAMAEALIDVLDHPGRAAQRAVRAREQFEQRHTIEVVTGAMVDFYSRCVSQPVRSRQ